MFQNFPNVKEIVFADDVVTTNVTDTRFMFQFCPNLESVYLGTGFDASKSICFCNMFNYNYQLKKITLCDNFNTSGCTYDSFYSMFDNSVQITELNMTGFEFENSGTSALGLLTPLSKLETITIPNKEIKLQYEGTAIALPSNGVWHLYDEN
ncbi:MAG: hypothetical protein MJ246_02055 [Clostridia bacterium]|nr:hypothetical protein [Clostridia bacterium]